MTGAHLAGIEGAGSRGPAMPRAALYLGIALIVAFCGYDGWFAWDRGYNPIYLVPMFGLSIYVVIRLATVARRPRTEFDA